MNSSFHRLKALKLAILLDGSESRLLTAQDSAAAKPLLLFQSKSHDWMDSIRKTTDCARWHSCEATFVYESHDQRLSPLAAPLSRTRLSYGKPKLRRNAAQFFRFSKVQNRNFVANLNLLLNYICKM